MNEWGDHTREKEREKRQKAAKEKRRLKQHRREHEMLRNEIPFSGGEKIGRRI